MNWSDRLKLRIEKVKVLHVNRVENDIKRLKEKGHWGASEANNRLLKKYSSLWSDYFSTRIGNSVNKLYFFELLMEGEFTLIPKGQNVVPDEDINYFFDECFESFKQRLKSEYSKGKPEQKVKIESEKYQDATKEVVLNEIGEVVGRWYTVEYLRKRQQERSDEMRYGIIKEGQRRIRVISEESQLDLSRRQAAIILYFNEIKITTQTIRRIAKEYGNQSPRHLKSFFDNFEAELNWACETRARINYLIRDFKSVEEFIDDDGYFQFKKKLYEIEKRKRKL